MNTNNVIRVDFKRKVVEDKARSALRHYQIKRNLEAARKQIAELVGV